MPEHAFDPKLKSAAADIRTVLQRYDIAGVVGLFSETHCEFMHEVSPSWSGAYVDPTTSQLRIRAKRADFKTEEQHRQTVISTIAMVHGIVRIAALWQQTAMLMIYKLRERLDIDIDAGPITPHKSE